MQKKSSRKGSTKAKKISMAPQDRRMLKAARKAVAFLDVRVGEIGGKKELKKWAKVRAKLLKAQKVLEKENGHAEMAELTTWLLFEDAVACPKGKQVLSDISDPWMNWWPPKIGPLMHEALMISLDVGRGFTAKEGKRHHQEWLDEATENRLYPENYYYNKSGNVEKISVRQEYLAANN